MAVIRVQRSIQGQRAQVFEAVFICAPQRHRSDNRQVFGIGPTCNDFRANQGGDPRTGQIVRGHQPLKRCLHQGEVWYLGRDLRPAGAGQDVDLL